MSFLDDVGRARALLEEHGRVSLRGLRRQFELDDDALEALVEELVDVMQVARRDGNVLTWTHGDAPRTMEPAPEPPTPSARAEAPARTIPADDTEAPTGERRQLTVLFCDLVDSTRISSALDPEDWREVVRIYQRATAAVIERFEGHVAQYLGDGILAYFGHPVAHEDDAERALRAGLDIVRGMSEVNASLPRTAGETELRVRIGVHTGPVVVGAMRSERGVQALGETTNVASALQDAARPDTVVMSAQTQRLVQGIFGTQDLGERALEGIAAPVRVLEVERVIGVRSRFDAQRGDAPLVGREQELGLFDDRFDQVAEGLGQAIVVSGEAGIGKSRIVQAFRERLGDRPHSWLECWCSPYTQDSAFHPTLDLIRQALGLRGGLGLDEQVAAVETALLRSDLPLVPNLSLLLELLGLPDPNASAALALAPEGKRLKLLALLTDWVIRLAEPQPLVLLVEDCHWADPSSLELLVRLIDQIPSSQVLIIATHRPDFEPPWAARGHTTPMLLSRLTRSQLTSLVRERAGERSLPDVWLGEIVQRSDGVPLYAEELTRTVIETNPADPADEGGVSLHVPETLQDSLMARLDALGPVKELAQLCAVLGREFDYELLLQVSPQREDDLRAHLEVATRQELFYQRGTPPEANYRFKHSLIRDAAYQSLLRSQRKRFHLRVAETLLDRSPQIAEQQPERVASHLAEAGDSRRALPLFRRAGELAAATFAHAEAESHYRRAIDLLPGLPDPDAELELDLYSALGSSAIPVHGFGSDEMKQIASRLRELVETTDPGPLPLRAMQLIASFHSSRGEMLDTIELARRTRTGGQQIGDRGVVSSAITSEVVALVMSGRFREARALIEHFDDFDATEEAEHASRFGISGIAFSGVYLSLATWCLGHADQADAMMREAVERAKQIEFPHTQASVLVTGGAFRSQMRHYQLGLAMAEEGREISAENGFALYEGIGRQTTARSRTLLGDLRTDEFLDAMQAAARTGNVQGAPITLCSAALMQRIAGDPDTALGTIDFTLNSISPQGQPMWDSELLRLRGEIQAEEKHDPASAEKSFQQSLAHARSLEAKILELRSAVSYARLLRDLDRKDEARDLLEPIYEWFTEGHGQPDLVDAKELVGELAQ